MSPNVKRYIGISVVQWGSIGALLFITVIGGILYQRGYRFQDNYMLGKMGEIRAVMPLQNTSLFLDTTKKITTTKDFETLTVKVSPKTHLILVSRPGYFPWAKKVTVPSGEKVTINPLFVTQNTTGQIITPNDPEYTHIAREVQEDVLPTKDKPRIAADGTKTWVEQNSILIDKNGALHTVLTPETEIKNLFFYKNRSDAVLFSTTESVFVIETDTQNTQNILPIFKGTNPYFITTDPTYIYVLDTGSLMAVVI